MKIGDHVVVADDWVGVITQLNFHPKYHLVWRLDNASPMSLLRHEKELTLLSKPVADILTAVNNHKE